MTSPFPTSAPSNSLAARLSRAMRARPRLALASTLGAPALWMLLVYVGSLLLLVAVAFFKVGKDGKSTTEFTTKNVVEALTTSEFVWAVIRSVCVAATVTALCLVVALPMAFYISKVAKPKNRRRLIVAVLLPLWAGYLVKAYAWKAIVTPDAGKLAAQKGGGFLASTFGWTPGYGVVAVVMALAYLWLPYMVLPIFAGLERLPPSYLDASGDLGARPLRTFRSVIMPILIPSIAAGSIFTFSLSLGDYITPKIITGGKFQMIGNLIDSLQQQNPALSAALTLWPIGIIVVYLIGMSKLRAFENV